MVRFTAQIDEQMKNVEALGSKDICSLVGGTTIRQGNWVADCYLLNKNRGRTQLSLMGLAKAANWFHIKTRIVGKLQTNRWAVRT